MFIAFADESEVVTQSVPMVGVGGAIASGKQWERIAKVWRKVLKTEPDVKVFHANEFATPEGRERSVYKDWSLDRCKDFGGKLINTLCKNHVELVSVATVKPSDYAEVVASWPRPIPPIFNAHYFCATWLLIQHKLWLDKFFPDQKITYYFESGGPHQTGMQTAYRDALNKRGVDEFFHFTREPAFVPKDTYLELQVADNLVYEATKRSSHYLDPDPPEKHSVPHPEIENARLWNVRYAADKWQESGMQIDVQWYNKRGIRDSFEMWKL
ncbi:MAG: hypothetical protein WBC19_10330 [Pyrinomonadaceae bacterium]